MPFDYRPIRNVFEYSMAYNYVGPTGYFPKSGNFLLTKDKENCKNRFLQQIHRIHPNSILIQKERTLLHTSEIRNRNVAYC